MIQGIDYVKAIENNLFDFIQAYCTASQGTIEESPTFTMVDSQILMPYFSGVVRTKLDSRGDTETIEKIITRFRRRSHQAIWWVTPDATPSSLDKLLEEHQCVFYSRDIGMALDLTRSLIQISHLDLQVTPITTNKDIDSWLEIYKLGYELSDEVASDYERILRTILNSYPTIGPYYLARLAGRPVATASLFIANDIPGIYEVATLPDFRGMGIGTKVVHTILQHIKQMGFTLAVLQSTNQGINIYKRLGFQNYCTIDSYLI